MTLDQLVLENIIAIVTTAFAGGGFFWMVKSMITRLNQHEANMKDRFDAHEENLQHRFDRIDDDMKACNQEIADLKARMATQEANAEFFKDVRSQIGDIWKHIVRLKATSNNE